MKILIIGGVAAGMTAAVNIKKYNPDITVKVFEKGVYISYSACGIPYFISNEINSIEQIILYNPEKMKAVRDIDVHINSEVISIDKRKKIIVINDLSSNKIYEEKYDKLILCTGAKPFIPNITGINNFKNIFTVRTINDAINIKKFINTNAVKNVAIIGSSFIGIELAESLLKNNIRVVMLEKNKFPIPLLPQDLSEILNSYFKNFNIEFHGEIDIQIIKSKNNSDIADEIITDKNKIDCDMIILTTGITPEIELATKIDLQINKLFKVIETDKKQQTSETTIYAAGDCTNTFNFITNKIDYVPLAAPARRQGEVAGINAAGGNISLKGMLNSWCIRFMELEIGSTGLNFEKAVHGNFDVRAVTIDTYLVPNYISKKNNLRLNFVYDKKTNRILGATGIGYRGTISRINLIATAVFNKMSLKNISELDLSYSPPFNTVFDPVVISAKKILNDEKQ